MNDGAQIKAVQEVHYKMAFGGWNCVKSTVDYYTGDFRLSK